MNLLRLQLAASVILAGIARIKSGQAHDGLRLIGRGAACLTGLLADVEASEIGIAADNLRQKAGAA